MAERDFKANAGTEGLLRAHISNFFIKKVSKKTFYVI